MVGCAFLSSRKVTRLYGTLGVRFNGSRHTSALQIEGRKWANVQSVFVLGQKDERFSLPAKARHYNKLKASKPAGVARVVTARRALGILRAIQRDQRSDTLILKKVAKM